MDAIILFSHGSVLCGAARPLAEHAARLRDAGCAPIVEIGFLNYTAPSFAQAVDRCVAAGASRIGVVPFFLVPGRFVSADLPRCVEDARREHPRLAFEIAEPLGYSAALAEAVHDLAAGARPIAEARDLLPRDPVSCEGDPACPLYDTVDCPRHPGAAAFPNTTTPEIASTRSADALLLLAHGSPRETANEPILRVAAAVRRRGAYRVVQVGFLDCNRPTIPEAIDACVTQGVASVVAVPFFLHIGTHVAQDLPALLIDGERRHACLRIQLAQHIGVSPLVTDVLAQRAAEALAR
jgi:sirohydrochlorin cobaltochelatase